MVVPTDTTVVLEITASDVIHSWWIPKLGGKADGVPGHVNETWFKIPAGKEGIYRGQCAELCGAGHADMRARVRAVTPDEFEVWARTRARTSRRRRGRCPSSASSARGRRPGHGSGKRSRSPPRRAPGRPCGRAGAAARLAAWLTTTDHKKIGILYLFTFVFFILGGVEALIMRLQLAQPDNTLVSPETYNGLVTMHGTTMVFLFVIPLTAGFGTTWCR